MFILRSVRVSEDDPTIFEDFRKLSEDVPKNSEALKFHDAFGID